MAEHQNKVSTQDCQIQTMAKIDTIKVKDDSDHISIKKRVRLALRRHFSLKFRRKARRILFNLKIRLSRINQGTNLPLHQVGSQKSLNLKAGDQVRVRSKEEIQATLNPWLELKGCSFISEMWQYCGTTQRVFKPVERFVDERDYLIKKTHGVILLEGVTCEGTSFYGKCDRACFLFWREEWLERI